MEAFATAEDLVGYYRIMDADEMERAGALLEYASALMLNHMGRNGVKVDPDDPVQAATLKGVCCSAVRRAMANKSGESVSAWGDATLYSSSGDVYFTKAEKAAMLGSMPRQAIGFISI